MKAPSPSPRYILFYNFLVTNPSFMKFGDFSYNLSRINILDFFFKIQTGFAVAALSQDQVLFFVYIFCWNNEHILDKISRI